MSPIVRRTPSESEAYLQGVGVGIAMVEKCLRRQLTPDFWVRPALKNARQQLEEIHHTMERQAQLEEQQK